MARVVLGANGIPCHIENEHFHVWHWLCADISGGFKVQVPREHAGEAARILKRGMHREPSESRGQSWQCSVCGWSVDGDWDVCWFCTTTRDGGRPEPPPESPVSDSSFVDRDFETDSLQIWAPAIVLPLVILFWATGGSIAAVVIGAAMALMVGCLGGEKRLPTATPPSEDTLKAERRAMAQPLTPSEQSYRRRVRMGNRIVERALISAVFGFVWFPPLLLLTSVLLWRLDQRRTPLGPWRRQEARLAWCLCVAGWLLLPVCVMELAEVVGDAVGLMGKWQCP